MRPSLLFLLLFLQALPGMAQIGPMANKGATRAVIVGISDYQDEHIPDLQFAHRDAQAMAEFLQSAPGGNVPPENIKLLLNEQATRGEIATAFYWLVGESKAGDRAIIYFSGHGDLENRILMDQGYLLAYDARAANYMGSGTYAVEMLQKVVQTLSLKQNVEVIMITDACRAGKLAGSETGGVIATAQGLAQKFANEVKILSCEPEQSSLESKDWGGGRGIFSYFLIDGLKGLADSDADLKVKLGEIRRYLDDEVSSRVEQNPMTVGSSSVDLFRVNEDTLLALQERKSLERENIAFAAPRSASLAAADTVPPLYRQFQQALAEGRLLYPEGGSAYSLFLQMQGEGALQPVLAAARLNLAAALQDGAQQAINAYLDASPEEMARRWQYDENYRFYPEYLNKAAELVGPGNVLYDDLKGRQAYFEGLVLRLLGETMAAGRDSIFRLAIRKQELAIGRDSLAAHAYNELGLVYLQLKNYPQSLALFEQAHDLSPGWVIPVGNISTALIEMKRYDEAVRYAEQALQLRQDYVPPHYNLGKIAFIHKDYRKAIEYTEETIAIDSAYAYAYNLMGLAWQKLDSLAQAYEAYQQAHRLNPKDALINFNLGYVAEQMQRPAEAIDHYKAAITCYPDYPEAHNNLGWLYLSSFQDYPEAEKYYRRYCQLKPKDTDGMVMVACTLSLQGRLDAALEWLEKALEGGYNGFDDLRSTPFLQNLQPDSRFVELLNRYGN